MRGALWRGVADAAFLTHHLAPGARVWDLGCGDGKFMLGLQQAGLRPVGIDFSKHALVAARARVPTALIRGDLLHLPIRPGSAPAIAARYVLGALDQEGRTRAAKEIVRALAPGGLLVVEEFSRQDFRFGEGNPVEPGTFERNRGILTHYFEAPEAAELFPSLALVTTDEVETTQRVGARRARRHRYRWFLRASASNSSRVAPADER